MERLRSALQLFEGTHPFHNYTKRRLYRAEAREGVKAKVLSWPPCVKLGARTYSQEPPDLRPPWQLQPQNCEL